MHRWLLLGCVALLAGCGGKAHTNPAAHASNPAAARVQRMKAIVHEWSTRLNAGNNAALAQLFRVPVLMTQGSYVFRLVNKSQVARWHASLPCAGYIVSITVHGRIATAVFRLGNRTTSKCDAPGTLAAARFTIVDSKIVAWEQIRVPPRAAAPVA
jgi:hypothetical protein